MENGGLLSSKIANSFPNVQEFVSIKVASEITGIQRQTLRKLGDSKKIQCYKTPSGQRKFHLPSLETMCFGIPNPALSTASKQNFIYARVSSRKQVDDLARQIVFLQSKRPEYLEYTVIQDVASGINFKRKGFNTILDACLHATIGEVIIAHKDRLCRFGYELVESIITKCGGLITIVSETSADNEKGKSTEQELAEDLLSIVHIYSCRQLGKRRYANRDASGKRPKIQPENSEVTVDSN
jgi:putative resolvase